MSAARRSGAPLQLIIPRVVEFARGFDLCFVFAYPDVVFVPSGFLQPEPRTQAAGVLLTFGRLCFVDTGLAR